MGFIMKSKLSKYYQAFYKWGWHDKVLKNKVDLPKVQSIFTVYDLFPINNVKVVKNEQLFLKKNIELKNVDSNAVHFLGAPFVERDKLPEATYFKWLLSVKHDIGEGKEVVYILHPWESELFGKKIKQKLGFEVIRFALPYELEIIKMPSLPGVVASWFCTALDNLSVANAQSIQLLSYKLPPFEKLNVKPNQKPIFDSGVEFYKRHLDSATRVEVREIPPLPQAVPPIKIEIEDPQKALARLVKVGGPLLRVVRLHPIERAGDASPFVMLNPKETIAMGLKRLLGEYYGISPNLSQLPSGILSFLDITDDVLQVRQHFAGKTLKRTALTFNIAVEGEKLIKFLLAENTLVYTRDLVANAPYAYGNTVVPEAEVGAEAPKPTLADLCSAIPECQQVFMPRSQLSGNALKYLDVRTLDYCRPPPCIPSIKISLVIEDSDARVLMAERRSFPSRSQFDLPSTRVAPGHTLDMAFGKLTKDLLGSEMLRLQAQPIVGFEQLVSYPEVHRKDEYILNVVYKIDLPNKYFVSMKATAELAKHTWWEPSTARKTPVVSVNAMMALDLYADYVNKCHSVEL